MKIYIITIFLLLTGLVVGQTIDDCDCTHFITSSNQNFPNPANITVCFEGNFEYNTNIVLKNGVDICIGEGVTINGNISSQNWGTINTIKNYGTISNLGSFDDNMANSIVHNYGYFERDINFNQGDSKEFNNYGTLKTNSPALGSGMLVNNANSELVLKNNTSLNSTFQFTAQGKITVEKNFTLNASLELENTQFTILGVFLFNSGTISTLSANSCSQLNFNSINNWHPLIVSNYGTLSISSFAESFSSDNVQGEVTTEACLPINEDVFIWEGSQNSQWTNPSNWNTNSVPTSEDNVIISENATFYPMLTTEASVGSIFFEAFSSLNLNDNTLIVNGNISGEVNILSTRHSSITINGGGDSYLFFDDSAAEIFDLVINDSEANVYLQSNLELYHLLELNSGTLNTNDLLTFECEFANQSPQSEVISTAQVAELGGELIGDVTVIQCYSGKRAFRLLGSAVNTQTSIRENWQENASAWNHDPNPGFGLHITGTGISSPNPEGIDGLNGFDWQPSGNPSMFTFNHHTNSWNAVSTTLDNLNAGSPYRLLIRGNRSTNITSNSSPPSQTKLRTKGKLHKGDFILNAGNLSNNQFVLFANPYQSDIDMSKVINDSDNVKPFFYIWDVSLNLRGAYAVIDAGSPSNRVPQGSDITKFSLPQQAGFLVANGQGEVIIRFKEEHKQPFINETTILSTENAHHISINLKSTSQNDFNNIDGVRINFHDDTSFAYQNASKNQNIDENLAIINNNELISIQNTVLPTDDHIIPLFINNYVDNGYTFQVNVEGLEQHHIYLVDNYTLEKHLVNGNQNEIHIEVDHSINSSIAFNRFYLELEAIPLSTEIFEKSDFTVYPNPVKDDFITISSSKLQASEAVIHLFDVQGRRVRSSKTFFNENGSSNLEIFNLSSGVYILRIETNDFTESIKIIKE